MLVVYSPECLGYEVPGHPESPDRVRRIYEELQGHGFRFVPAEPAKREDILLAHSQEHFSKIAGKGHYDLETPPIDIRFPLLAAGVTIKAGQQLGFALTRPPGHHAGRSSQEGFCYFNNIAIAVKKLGKRTAILDIDTHHGNGTQEIFLGAPDVLYVSLHQSPLYPMTGLRHERNCRNFPLFPGTKESDYIKTLLEALRMVEAFSPELLAISVGFDTYKGDPLAGQQVTEHGYARIGRHISDLGIPTFMALEGGYSQDIGKLCLSFLNGFQG